MYEEVIVRVQKALISMRKMLQSSIMTHVHLLYPVRAHDLTNQLAQNLLVCSPSLSQNVRRQEAKYRIYYLRNNDSGSIFSRM